MTRKLLILFIAVFCIVVVTGSLQANVVCDTAWPFADQHASCVNEVGGIANIYFNSATQATVDVIEGFGAAGDACIGGGTATPAE
jgi:hypothetical protein